MLVHKSYALDELNFVETTLVTLQELEINQKRFLVQMLAVFEYTKNSVELPS